MLFKDTLLVFELEQTKTVDEHRKKQSLTMKILNRSLISLCVCAYIYIVQRDMIWLLCLVHKTKDKKTGRRGGRAKRKVRKTVFVLYWYEKH